MNKKVDVQLVKLIQDAAGNAIKLLFSQHKEKFYYCSIFSCAPAHLESEVDTMNFCVNIVP